MTFQSSCQLSPTRTLATTATIEATINWAEAINAGELGLKAMPIKTDRRDAEGIARLLYRG